MKPPEPALPHRPTVPRPRRPGERDGEKPTAPPWLFPPPSSAPSSPSDNGSTGKCPNPGGPRSPPCLGGAPTPAPPLSPALGFGVAPLAKGVPGREPGLGPPAFAAPPQCSDLTHPKQVPIAPPAPGSEGKRWGGSAKARPPNALDLCSGLLLPRANPPSPGRPLCVWESSSRGDAGARCPSPGVPKGGRLGAALSS